MDTDERHDGCERMFPDLPAAKIDRDRDPALADPDGTMHAKPPTDDPDIPAVPGIPCPGAGASKLATSVVPHARAGRGT